MIVGFDVLGLCLDAVYDTVLIERTVESASTETLRREGSGTVGIRSVTGGNEDIPLDAGQPPTGRDHNHHGFTVWLAGGGVRGGMAYGATDEFGYRAVENRVHVHDLHATMLQLMGFDHEQLTYHFAGRDFRLTDVHGRVVKEILDA